MADAKTPVGSRDLTPEAAAQQKREEESSYIAEICAHVTCIPKPLAKVIGAYATCKGQRVVFQPRSTSELLWCTRVESARTGGTIVDDDEASRPAVISYDLPKEVRDDTHATLHMASQSNGTALLFGVLQDHKTKIDPDIIAESPSLLPVRTMSSSHIWQWTPWRANTRGEGWLKLWPLPVCVRTPMYPVSDALVFNNSLYVLVFSKGQRAERTLFRCDLATGEWTALPIVPGLDVFCYQFRGALCSHVGALAVTMGSYWTIWSEERKEWQAAELVAETERECVEMNTDFYLSTGECRDGQAKGVYYICNTESESDSGAETLCVEFIPDYPLELEEYPGSESEPFDAQRKTHSSPCSSPCPSRPLPSSSTDLGTAWETPVRLTYTSHLVGSAVVHGALHMFYLTDSSAPRSMFCLIFDKVGDFKKSSSVACDAPIDACEILVL